MIRTTKETTMTNDGSTISPAAARLSFTAAVAFLVLLAILHVIKPDYDPSWRFISEYLIGDYGWVMMLAFFFLALSCAALFAAVRSQVGATGGKIGLGLLLIVAASLIAAGIFTADPITAKPDELTTHGNLHGLAAMVGIPGLPIAAVLISRSLVRNQSWSSAGRSILWTAHLIWISVVAMFVYLFVVVIPRPGGFGPDLSIGWLNRLVVLTYCGWLMTVAWRAIKLRGQHPGDRGDEKK